MVSSSRVEIKKLNGNFFESWKINMEDILVDKEQWGVMDPSTKLNSMSKEDWDKLDKKVRSTIFLYLSDSMILNVYIEDDEKKI